MLLHILSLGKVSHLLKVLLTKSAWEHVSLFVLNDDRLLGVELALCHVLEVLVLLAVDVN